MDKFYIGQIGRLKRLGSKISERDVWYDGQIAKIIDISKRKNSVKIRHLESGEEGNLCTYKELYIYFEPIEDEDDNEFEYGFENESNIFRKKNKEENLQIQRIKKEKSLYSISHSTEMFLSELIDRAIRVNVESYYIRFYFGKNIIIDGTHYDNCTLILWNENKYYAWLSKGSIINKDDKIIYKYDGYGFSTKFKIKVYKKIKELKRKEDEEEFEFGFENENKKLKYLMNYEDRNS